MTDQIEKKKSDIYSLYKKEKTVHIEDDDGNYVDVLLAKMTQGDRIKILDAYNEHLEEQRLKLREREEKYHSLALAIERYSDEDLITGLIAFESAQRGEIADLYPTLEGKTEEEKAKVISEELEKFSKFRRDVLSKETRQDLTDKFISMTIESQALIDSVRMLNYLSLVHMCFNLETRQPIFSSISDVEKISDRRVIDTLVEEVNALRTLETQKEARKIATSDSTFLAPGESQKS